VVPSLRTANVGHLLVQVVATMSDGPDYSPTAPKVWAVAKCACGWTSGDQGTAADAHRLAALHEIACEEPSDV
jgi:hypothetical protein